MIRTLSRLHIGDKSVAVATETEMRCGMTEDEAKLVAALRKIRDEQRAVGDRALKHADTLEETARMIESWATARESVQTSEVPQ